MVKTLLTALFTFLGLKGVDYAITKITVFIKWFIFLIFLLVAIRIVVPLSIWYVHSIGDAIKPITNVISASFKSVSDQIQASAIAAERARNIEAESVMARLAEARIHYPYGLYVTMEGGQEVDTGQRYSKKDDCDQSGAPIPSESPEVHRWSGDNTRDRVVDFNCRTY